MQANLLVIPVDNAIALFWRTKYPDLEELFDGDNLRLAIAPNSYRPIWEAASTVNRGYCRRYVDPSLHRLEGFDINLARECNCASIYYLLRDLEETAKLASCGSYTGITLYDYLLPDLEDIKADLEFSTRQVTIEIETTSGTMGIESDRSVFGAKLMFGILDVLP